MGQGTGGFNGAFRSVPWGLQIFVAVITVVSLGMWALVGLGGLLAALGIEPEPEQEQVSVGEPTTSTTREVIRPTTTSTTSEPTIRTTTSTTAPPPTTTTTADPFGDLSAAEQAALDAFFNPPPPPPPPAAAGGGCSPNYSGCVPIASDVDCAGGSGNGPAYTSGPVTVIGSDIYGLDADNDGIGCE
jgi:hypothetical protein